MANSKSKRADSAGEAPKQKAPKAAKPAKEAPATVGKVQQLREFFEQSWREMHKVTWPTRKETIATSIAVLVMVVFMSIFLGIVDFSLAKAIEAILS